jgi:hypothetical protein
MLPFQHPLLCTVIMKIFRYRIYLKFHSKQNKKSSESFKNTVIVSLPKISKEIKEVEIFYYIRTLVSTKKS